MPPKNTAPEPSIAIAMNSGTVLGTDPAMDDLKAQIAALTKMVQTLAASQPTVSANHKPIAPLPTGVVRVVAVKQGTYPSVDLATGKKGPRSFLREPGEVFLCLREEMSPEPVHRDDAAHGWMRLESAATPYVAATEPPPTPVTQLIPDPLASVPFDTQAPTQGGFVQR